MKTFNWEEARLNYCEEAYNYLSHVHRKNIQEVDFVRGYTSLPHKHCFSGKSKDKARAVRMYKELNRKYGFFIKENFV